MVATNDQWIVERTGIRERHIAGPEAATSDLATAAAREALAARGIQPSEVDVILVRTVWLVVAIATGVGFIAYFAAWMIMPSDYGQAPQAIFVPGPQTS